MDGVARARAFSALSVLVTLLAPARAAAAGANGSSSVAHAAPAGCPEPGAFTAAIRARAPTRSFYGAPRRSPSTRASRPRTPSRAASSACISRAVECSRRERDSASRVVAFVDGKCQEVIFGGRSTNDSGFDTLEP